MAEDSLRLGLVQMTSGDGIAENVATVVALYREGAAAGAELIVFPENTLYFRIRSKDGVREPSAEHVRTLSSVVDEAGVPLMVTTAREPRDGRFANATILFRPGVAPEVPYEKMHLFDTEVGGRRVRESDHFRAGGGPRLVDVAGWRVGLSICYDLRFPELYLNYAQKADLILAPSAFLTKTGPAHWHVLLRARAIEAQAYVAAPAQVGTHRSGTETRETYGHALVVGPWGDVRLDLERKTGVRVIELARADVNKMREEIPVADHRRPC